LSAEHGVEPHTNCNICGNSSYAQARQSMLENSPWAKALEAGVEKLDSALSRLVYGHGRHTSEELVRRGKTAETGRHLVPAEPSRLAQVSKKHVAAGTMAFLSAAAPTSPVLEALANPAPHVSEAAANTLANRPVLFSPEAIISPRLIDFSDVAADEIAEPLVISPDPVNPEVTLIETVTAVEQPLVRTLFPGQTIRDFVNVIAGDLPRPQRVELIQQVARLSGVDLAAGEDRGLRVGFELRLPIETADTELYTVKRGDTAAQLYAELGWPEKGDRFEQVL
jgi:hypothetical protein